MPALKCVRSVQMLEQREAELQGTIGALQSRIAHLMQQAPADASGPGPQAGQLAASDAANVAQLQDRVQELEV